MRTQEKKLPQTLSRWNIPNTWEWVSIADIGSVITGNTPPTKDAMNYGNDIPFVKPPELLDKGIWAAPGGLSQKGIKTARTLPVGAILVSCIGGLGKTGIAKVPVAFNQQINAIVFNDIVIPEYGFYYTQTLKGWLYDVASATTLPIVNKGKFQKAPFPLASPNEQKRIVSEIEKQFSRLDEAVAALKRIKANLNRYKASVLKAAVEGKLTEEWRKANPDMEPASELLKRILLERRRKWEEVELKKMRAKGKEPKDDKWKKKYKEPIDLYQTNVFSLPESWIWTRVNWVCESQTGPFGTQLHKSDYTNAGIPTIEIGDVHPTRNLKEGTKNFISKNKANNLERFEVKKGDVLFSRVGTVGRCTIVPSGCDGWIMSTSLIRVRVMSEYLLSKYLLLYFWSPISQYFTKQTTKGTTRSGTNSKIVGELPLIIPPIIEQQKIIEEIESRISIAEEVEEEIDNNLKRAERLRQSILKKAFSGKLLPQEGK